MFITSILINDMILLLLISFLWAYLEGKREAKYFHYKWILPNPTKVKDEHFDFTLQRSLYVIMSSLLAGFIFKYWLAGAILFISIALTFSFFHNGSYYKKRNELNENVYLFRWRDESTTTTANFSFSYKSRLIQFIIGVVLSLGFDLLFLFKLIN